MAHGRVKLLWCVRDGGPESKLEDVLFLVSMRDATLHAVSLTNYIRGTGLDVFKAEHHMFYFDHRSALMDAKKRLASAKVEQWRCLGCGHKNGITKRRCYYCGYPKDFIPPTLESK